MRIVLASLLLALVLSPAAGAKEGGPAALVVCGQTACREDRAEALRQSSVIMLTYQHRHPTQSRPFFDVMFLDPEGLPRLVHLRFAPALRLNRQDRGSQVVWYRVPRKLERELAGLTAGLTPRPAAQLDSPAGTPPAYRAPVERAVPAAAEAGAGPATTVGTVLALAVGLALVLWASRRRRAGFPLPH